VTAKRDKRSGRRFGIRPQDRDFWSSTNDSTES
jgi:hypothetical protein